MLEERKDLFIEIDEYEEEIDILNTNETLIPIEDVEEIIFGKEILDPKKFVRSDLTEFSGKFMGYKLLDVTTPEFQRLLHKSQIGVREKQLMQDQNVLENFAMKASLLQGFFYNDPLPCVDENGCPWDGRTRLGNASELAEKYSQNSELFFGRFPVAQYEFEDKSVANRIAVGQRLNVHRPASSATMKDFEEGALSAIRAGDISNSRHEIEYHLRRAGIGLRWDIQSPDGKGILTKIINNTHNRSKNIKDIAEVMIQEKSMWEKWCNDNGHTLRSNRVLLSVDTRDYAYRAFHEIIAPAVLKNNTPIEIIGYTNKKRSGEARKARKVFFEILDDCYEDSHNVSYSRINPNLDKPWKDIGSVPQIIGEHDIDGNKLVKPSKY